MAVYGANDGLLSASSIHSNIQTAAISRLAGVPGEGWASVAFEEHEQEAEQVRTSYEASTTHAASRPGAQLRSIPGE